MNLGMTNLSPLLGEVSAPDKPEEAERNEENKLVKESHPMVGGVGPYSYAQNSIHQKAVIDAAKGLLIEGIRHNLDFDNPYFDNWTTFRIVDLGCAAGPNTFFAVKNIIEAVRGKYNSQLRNSNPLEFQVFFNDVNGNDFNVLFKTLPLYQDYFVAGVPGSFYTRLFPKSSIHLAHSSYSLHWLSKVPSEILDSSSLAWNKGSIQCTGFAREVAKVYLAQFKNDMDVFLNARAEEIVDAGLMAIIIGGRPNGVPMSRTEMGLLYDIFGSCLNDMTNLGEISKEKVDSFNLPIYYSSPEELQNIIEENGHFSIERREELVIPSMNNREPIVKDLVISGLRAVFEELLKEHFGSEDFVNKLFEHFTNKLHQYYCTFDEAVHKSIDLVILLKRKIN